MICLMKVCYIYKKKSAIWMELMDNSWIPINIYYEIPKDVEKKDLISLKDWPYEGCLQRFYDYLIWFRNKIVGFKKVKKSPFPKS